MKLHKGNSSLIGIVMGFTLITLGFQNCTKASFTVDEAARQKALNDGSVFDHGNDGAVAGTAPGNDGNMPGGTVTPGNDGAMPKTPVAGNDPSTPGLPGMPGMPTMGNDPSMPKTPRTGNNSTVPGTSGNDPSKISVTLTCPSSVHHADRLFADAGEVKVVFVKDSLSGQMLCEVHNIKKQIMEKRSIDISSCQAALASESVLSYYIVEETVTSDYQKYSFNPMLPSDIVYAYMNDAHNQANCDISGDPLLVQLNTKVPQPIELTAPDKGVMFDLLGRRANHEKVRTSWFATAKTENYFLVLPDAKGQVNGIDELFGDATFGPDKRFAKQGFDALAKYDENRDHMISSDDEVFSQLRLWKDENLDGIVQANELSTLDEKGVVAIDLRYDKRYFEKDQHGNMTKFKSVVIMKDNSYGLVYDLWLRYIAK